VELVQHDVDSQSPGTPNFPPFAMGTSQPERLAPLVPVAFNRDLSATPVVGDSHTLHFPAETTNFTVETSQSKPRVHDVGELEHHLQIYLQHSIQIPHCNKHHRREVETLMCDSAIPSSDESSLWMERRNQQGCMRPRNGGRRGPGRPGPSRPVCCRFWGEHPIGCGDLAKLYETKLTATFASA
jgi:hypothetical protein